MSKRKERRVDIGFFCDKRDDNVIDMVDVNINSYSEDRDQYCIKCGKSRYSDFTYFAAPIDSNGWSRYKICPTCYSWVEIFTPDRMSGISSEHINYLKVLDKPFLTDCGVCTIWKNPKDDGKDFYGEM